MTTQPSTTEQSAPEPLRGESIIYGAVHLEVTDLERSLAFWRDLIGLGELPSPAGEVRLGVDERALVVLHPGAVRPAGRGHAGLYHLAIHLPDEVAFARALVRIGQARVPQSPTDHIFSKATYLHDPDGLLLELTLETPQRFRSIETGAGSVFMVDSEGRRRAPTEPLDVAAAIAPLEGGEADGPLDPGSYIGHVHLHVPDLQSANVFYRDVIGFQEHAFMSSIGMADLSAGGRFPHRIALNNWHGPTARQREPQTAGMLRFELRPHEPDELLARAAAAGIAVSRGESGDLSLGDPAGNEIIVLESGA